MIGVVEKISCFVVVVASEEHVDELEEGEAEGYRSDVLAGHDVECQEGSFG